MSAHREVLQILEPTLAALTEAGLAAGDGALARVWLAGPGDLCEACPMRPECQSRPTCLHLVASAGFTSRVDGPFRRFPVGARIVGRVPVTREPLIARADLQALGVAEPGWLALHDVRAFAALPLEHGERCIGVLAVFSRGALPNEQLRLLAAAARLGAEAIGNVAAYRALAADRNRLAARNARLRSGLGLPPEPELASLPPPAPGPVSVTPPAPGPASLPPPAPGPVSTAVAPVTDRSCAVPAVAPGTAAAHVAGTDAVLRADTTAPRRPRVFAEVQRQGILQALAYTGWRVSGPKGAAVLLGLRPTTLESKMKRLGIRRPPR